MSLEAGTPQGRISLCRLCRSGPLGRTLWGQTRCAHHGLSLRGQTHGNTKGQGVWFGWGIMQLSCQSVKKICLRVRSCKMERNYLSCSGSVLCWGDETDVKTLGKSRDPPKQKRGNATACSLRNRAHRGQMSRLGFPMGGRWELRSEPSLASFLEIPGVCFQSFCLEQVLPGGSGHLLQAEMQSGIPLFGSRPTGHTLEATGNRRLVKSYFHRAATLPFGRLAIKIDDYTGVIKLFIEFEKNPLKCSQKDLAYNGDSRMTQPEAQIHW